MDYELPIHVDDFSEAGNAGQMFVRNRSMKHEIMSRLIRRFGGINCLDLYIDHSRPWSSIAEEIGQFLMFEYDVTHSIDALFDCMSEKAWGKTNLSILALTMDNKLYKKEVYYTIDAITNALPLMESDRPGKLAVVLFVGE